MRVSPVTTLIALAILGSLAPAPASAQWHLGLYMGGDHTKPADIHVVDPTTDTDITYARIAFDAKPFEAPQYYGWRLGRSLGHARTFGIELEFTHLKMYAQVDVPAPVTGRADGAVVSGVQPMNVRVQRYSMSHGLNFMLVNLTARVPLGPTGGRTTLVLRGGAGPTLPHAETQVNGVGREQYEWAGLGGNGSAGVEIRLSARVAFAADYKLTYARPTITLAGDGKGQTTALSHHLAVGVVLGLGR